jgi:ABC-2 type transport system permease protein
MAGADLITVYRVELLRRIRSRPFVIGLLIGAIGIFVMTRLPGFLNEHVGQEQSRVVLAGPPALVAQAKPLLAQAFTIAAITTDTAAPSPAALEQQRAGREVVLARAGGGLRATVYSTNPASVDERTIARLLLPLNVQLGAHVSAAQARRLVRLPVDVRGVGGRFGSVAMAQVARGVSFTMIFLLYLLVILNSQLTMSGVVEEKTNRIAELLISAVDPIALLYGKILAGATLGILQMIVWCGAAFVAGVSGGPQGGAAHGGLDIAGALHGALGPATIGAFVFFLIVGLLEFSTIFAGIGSLISRPEDLGAINAAMTVPIIAALFIAIAALDAPNAPVVVASSFIPLLSPFTMFARIATSQPPLWQMTLSAAINVASVVAIALFCGRLYRVGMLLYGRPPTLRQVWRTLRT